MKKEHDDPASKTRKVLAGLAGVHKQSYFLTLLPCSSSERSVVRNKKAGLVNFVSKKKTFLFRRWVCTCFLPTKRCTWHEGKKRRKRGWFLQCAAIKVQTCDVSGRVFCLIRTRNLQTWPFKVEKIKGENHEFWMGAPFSCLEFIGQSMNTFHLTQNTI